MSLGALDSKYATLTYDIRKTKGAAQVNFTGNVTTLRQHIRCMGGKHCKVYHEHCITNGIDVHPTAIPNDIKNKLESPDGEQQLTTSFVEVRPDSSKWEKDKLLDLVVHFMVEMDQVMNSSLMC